jgi:predicted nucleotidyltransferase/predicted transcriptional regulator with HTH domain
MVNFIELTKSRLRKKLLSYFFTNPESNFYLREIASIVDTDPGNLSKELSKLENEGVFLSHERGNQKYFLLNKDYPLYKELKSIIFKTIGIKGALEELLKNIKGICSAFIYGSYAKSKERASSDIDLMLLVDKDIFSEKPFLEKIHGLKQKLSREINYSYYPLDEWLHRVKKRDSFILNVLTQPKIMLIGDKDELQRLSKQRYAEKRTKNRHRSDSKALKKK